MSCWRAPVNSNSASASPGAGLVVRQELLDVGGGPGVIASALDLRHGLDIARQVGRQIVVIDAPAAERGQMLAAVGGGAGLVGLHVDQAPDFLRSDILQRTIAHRLRIVIGERLTALPDNSGGRMKIVLWVVGLLFTAEIQARFLRNSRGCNSG
jgi:hypothetical protein